MLFPSNPPSPVANTTDTDSLPRVRRSDLADLLGLLPTSKRPAQRTQSESKAALLIDLTMDDNENEVVLTSPTTPRSKSLIAALVKQEVIEDVDLDDDVDAADDDERVAPEASSGRQQEHVVRRKSILSVDFSSPLGSRVLESMKRQSKRVFCSVAVNICTNYSDFCRETSKPNTEQSGGRLRDRKELVTFNKKNRRVNQKWAHSYKFTRAQRIEWYRTSVAGVNKRGRQLKRAMSKCSVSVSRLNDVTLGEWSKRHSFPMDWLRHMTPQECTLLLENHGSTLTNLAAIATALRHKAAVSVAWRQVIDEITRLRELRGLPQPKLVVSRMRSDRLPSPQRKLLEQYQERTSHSRHVVSDAGDRPNSETSSVPSPEPTERKSGEAGRPARRNVGKMRGPKRVNGRRDSANSVQSSVASSDSTQSRRGRPASRNTNSDVTKNKTSAKTDAAKPAQGRVNGAHNGVAMKSTGARGRKPKRDAVVIDDSESCISLSSENSDATAANDDSRPPGKLRKLNGPFVPLPVQRSYRFHCQQCNQVLHDVTDMETLVKRHYRTKHGISGVRMVQRRSESGEMRIDILIDPSANSKKKKNAKSSHNSVICID